MVIIIVLIALLAIIPIGGAVTLAIIAYLLWLAVKWTAQFAIYITSAIHRRYRRRSSSGQSPGQSTEQSEPRSLFWL